MLKQKEHRALPLIWIFTLLVHGRSLFIWFDWETVRFFVQPRPGRYRWLEVWTGGWVDLTDYGIRVASLTYRPFMAYLFQVESILFKTNAWAYHITNLLAHLLCVTCVYYLAARMRFNPGSRVCAALLFAMHPLVTQPLWILVDGGEQFVLLFGLLMLLSLGGNRIWSGIFLALALICKETAITVPVWAILFDWLFNIKAESIKGKVIELVRRHWPYWIITIIYLLIRGWALEGVGGYRSVQHFQLSNIRDIMSWNLAWLLGLSKPFNGIIFLGIGLLILSLLPGISRGIRFSVWWPAVFLLPVHNLCNKWYLYTTAAALGLLAGSFIEVAARRHMLLARFAMAITFIAAVMFGIQSYRELGFQQRNAQVPVDLAAQIKALYPELPGKNVICRMVLPHRVQDLKGHWFNPASFEVKAQKSALESIVWDLNATRFLPGGKPIWTRSVEAAVRLVYNDISIKVELSDSYGPQLQDAVIISYDPVKGVLSKGI